MSVNYNQCNRTLNTVEVVQTLPVDTNDPAVNTSTDSAILNLNDKTESANCEC